MLKPLVLPTDEQALPGRDTPVQIADKHYVNGHSMRPPYGCLVETILFGLGCFWGAERKFWEHSGVYVTAVGYAGGLTPNPSYQEVCTGLTGHNEVVRVVYEPNKVSLWDLLALFWQSHNPTQGMRQGNDVGTQYRSGIYTYQNSQMDLALISRTVYSERLEKRGYSAITTEIISAPEFYFAEDYHQQYLAKNPQGYCGLGGLGLELGPQPNTSECAE